MPEGPEIKYLSEKLKPFIGEQLQMIDLSSTRLTKDSDTQCINLLSNVDSQNTIQIHNIYSHGKVLIIELENNITFFIGFGLTGYIDITNEKPLKYIQFVFSVKQSENVLPNTFISMEDKRRFGFITILQNQTLIKKKLNELGPDLMDFTLSDNVFISRLSEFENRNITVGLMEQSIISGCGNYLKSEALYRCNISPWIKIKDVINERKLECLVQTLRHIMLESYEHQLNGDWIYTNEKSDNFKNWLRIYGKKITDDNKKIIVETTPDGRKTYWVTPSEL